MPVKIGAAISAGKATLHELQTVYGIEDLETIVEILVVDSRNQRKLTQKNG